MVERNNKQKCLGTMATEVMATGQALKTPFLPLLVSVLDQVLLIRPDSPIVSPNQGNAVCRRHWCKISVPERALQCCCFAAPVLQWQPHGKGCCQSRIGSKICLKHSSHSIGVYPELLDGPAGSENSKNLVVICLGLEAKNLKVTTQTIHSKILYWSLRDKGVLSELECEVLSHRCYWSL